jgi:two-component system phosphate regulon sensor histidine kinase PhoR
MESRFVAALLQAMPMAVVLIGRDGRIAAANDPAERLFGPRLVGRPHAFVLRQPDLDEAISAALSGIQPGPVRLVLTGPASESVFRVNVTPVDGEGRAGVLCAFADITGEERIGQMRRDFVANVSHELRTPLTALLGFIETLRGAARDDPAARDRFLGIMASEAGRMNRLVRDLLSLSRVEAEERVRPTQAVDVAALAASAIASLRPVAETARVDLSLVGGGEPAVVPGDADQIAQVLQNLIENAIKYGGAGGRVRVTLERGREEPWLRVPGLAVSVSDSGEGIDPIHLPRLTERFYRVDTHRSREQGGTGLGLAIVKHIVNRHRGRLRIDSEPGQGSTFTVVLPSG